MSKRFTVGLLQAGYVHPDVASSTGDYPALFDRLFEGRDIDLVVRDIQREGTPSDVAADGWIISGSASSAYDDEPWIADLEDFARGLMEREAPLVGICFGHQVLAQAMGGRVERADVGWGVGVHRYDLVGGPEAWTGADAPAEVRMVASHRDQVTELPDGAETWLSSEFCPNAGYTLGSNAMTIQAHPEFTTDVSAGLLDVRREMIGPDRCDDATATLAAGTDAGIVASWIDTFLRTRS